MKLSVFGLGYVGTVSAACFAMRGHNVIGVDSNCAKTGLINQRRAPIVEKDIGGIVARAVEAGMLRATTDSSEAVLESARKMSLEGIVSKQLDDVYRAGQRGWIKIKCRAAQEVVLGGWTSEGGRFRSLLAGVYRDERLVYTERIGTGFGEGVINQILPLLKDLTVDKNPFEGQNAPRHKTGVHWLKPQLVAQIELAGWTDDGQERSKGCVKTGPLPKSS